MNDKQTCIYLFNAIINKQSISFDKELVPFVTEYLTEIKYEKINEIIILLQQRPELISNQLFMTMIDYYCKKHCIFSLLAGKQIILFYE